VGFKLILLRSTSLMAFRNKAQRSFVKKGIDAEESRRKREEMTIQLRKQKRDEQVVKRRQAAPSSPGSSAPPGNRADIEEKLKMLPQLVVSISSDNPTLQLEAATQFRRLLSIERNPPIQEVIDSGIVPRLVQFLTFQNNEPLQFEAAWALTNIASGTNVHTKVVIDQGAIPIFVQLLRSPNEEVREQVVWALGNIAGDSPQCRDAVLMAGALEPLLQLCTPDAKISVLRNATWTLSNFCRGKPQPEFQLVRGALPTLAGLIGLQDDDVLTDACWALSYLSDDPAPGSNQKIQAVIEAGVARRLTELLAHPSSNVKTPALRTVGNIVTGDDIQTDTILRCSALLCLQALLTSPKKGIRKEACWTISNITAGNTNQIQQVINANIIPSLVQILRNSEFDVQKEAAWAISNATSGGNDEQIIHLVQQGVIPPLCNLFNCPHPKMILVAMEGIENILEVGRKIQNHHNETENKFATHVEECEGLDLLEKLQEHDNSEIYEKAVKIIREFFDPEEDEQDLAPNQQGNQFMFQAPNQATNFQF